MAEHEEIERRLQLAAQVARLEERSVNTQEQLARIERLIGQQGAAMEKMMGEFTQKIDNLETSIEEKIDPIKSQVNFWRGGLWIVGGAVVIIIGVVLKLWLGV